MIFNNIEIARLLFSVASLDDQCFAPTIKNARFSMNAFPGPRLTPLHYAVYLNNYAMAYVILEMSTSPEHLMKHSERLSRSALGLVVERDAVEMLKLFLDFTDDDAGLLLFCVASQHCCARTKIFRFIATRRPRKLPRSVYSEVILQNCVKIQDVQTFRLLWNEGCRFSQADASESLRSIALQGESTALSKIARLILSQYPRLARDGVSMNWWITAAEKGSLSFAKVLVSFGADPDEKSALLLMAATRNKQRKFVDWLVESRSANVNATDTQGATALHVAIRDAQSVSIARTLVLAGADVNALDFGHRSPLQEAVLLSNDKSVRIRLAKLLLESGAEDGMLAFAETRCRRCKELIQANELRLQRQFIAQVCIGLAGSPFPVLVLLALVDATPRRRTAPDVQISDAQAWQVAALIHGKARDIRQNKVKQKIRKRKKKSK